MLHPSLLAILTVVAQTTSAAQGKWSVDRHLDTSTGQASRTAQVVNHDGLTLKIYRRRPGGKVWADLTLPSNTRDVFDAPLPLYRIDNLQAVQVTKPIKDLLGPTVETRPASVSFLVWHGEGPTPNRGPLRNLMDGSLVVFRYYLAGRGAKETRFSLMGAKVAIAEALEITADPAPGAIALDDSRIRAASRCLEFMRAPARRELYVRCLDIINETCAKSSTAVEFEACLERNQFSKLFRQ